MGPIGGKRPDSVLQHRHVEVADRRNNRIVKLWLAYRRPLPPLPSLEVQRCWASAGRLRAIPATRERCMGLSFVILSICIFVMSLRRPTLIWGGEYFRDVTGVCGLRLPSNWFGSVPPDHFLLQMNFNESLLDPVGATLF